MNELAELTKVRADVQPMSQQARLAGRRRLGAAMSPGDRSSRLSSRRTLVAGVACGVALTAAATAALVIGTPGTQQPAAAAEVLNRAAAALEAAPDPIPRAGQFVYKEIRQKTSAQGPDFHTFSWVSADGTRPGKSLSVDESPGCKGEKRCTTEQSVPVDDRKGSLGSAPYSALAALPTEPDALLAALRRDPAVRQATPSPAVAGPKVTADHQVWSLIRSIAEDLPSAQRAALFRAAAGLDGIKLYPGITDAAGRAGDGVGMDDPRLGRVVLVFDRDTHRNIGEVILQGDQVTFNRAVLKRAVVDAVGQKP